MKEINHYSKIKDELSENICVIREKMRNSTECKTPCNVLTEYMEQRCKLKMSSQKQKKKLFYFLVKHIL